MGNCNEKRNFAKEKQNKMKVEYSEDGKQLIKAQDVEGHFVIPNSVKKIGYHAFRFCKGLKSIEIPDSVTEIDEGAFDATGINAFHVDEGNPNYCSESGILYNKDKSALVAFPPEYDLDHFELSHTVRRIADSAFFVLL